MTSEVSAEFISSRCEDYCIKVADGTHDSPKETEEGKLLVTSKNLKNGRLTLDSAYLISIEDFDQINRRSKVDQWDVLLTMIGTVGEVCLVMDEHPDFAIKNVGLLKCQDKLKAKWLYYYLRSSECQAYIESRKKGSTQQYLSLSDIRNLPISHPTSSEVMEKSIQILDSLDRQISLLMDINESLSLICQAIFKSWFIDFKFDGDTNHQKKKLPDGWTEGFLSDILKFHNQRTTPSDITAELPYVPIDSISSKSPFLNQHKSGSEAKSSLQLFNRGDILFGAMRPYFHKVCIAPFDGVTRSTVFVLKPVNEGCNYFALFTAFQETVIDFATRHSEGSTIPYAKWRNSLEKMPTIVPPELLQKKFTEIVSPMIDSALNNIERMQVLSDIRDSLLPRLIAGKINIASIEIDEATNL